MAICLTFWFFQAKKEGGAEEAKAAIGAAAPAMSSEADKISEIVLCLMLFPFFLSEKCPAQCFAHFFVADGGQKLK